MKQGRAEGLRRLGWIGRGDSWTHPSMPMLIGASLAAAERISARPDVDFKPNP